MAFLLEETNLGRGKRKEFGDPGRETASTCVMGSLARVSQIMRRRSPSRALSRAALMPGPPRCRLLSGACAVWVFGRPCCFHSSLINCCQDET